MWVHVNQILENGVVMKLSEVRTFALSLPGSTEEPHFDKSSFRVKGKIFVTVPEDEEHVHVFVDADETRAAVTSQPDAYEELWWGKTLSGVRVTLKKAKSRDTIALIEDAWRRKAPKNLVAEFDGP
jgi:hypothetical protein